MPADVASAGRGRDDDDKNDNRRSNNWCKNNNGKNYFGNATKNRQNRKRQKGKNGQYKSPSKVLKTAEFQLQRARERIQNDEIRMDSMRADKKEITDYWMKCLQEVDDLKDESKKKDLIITELKDDAHGAADREDIDRQMIKNLKVRLDRTETQRVDAEETITRREAHVEKLMEELGELEQHHAESTNRLNDLEKQLADLKIGKSKKKKNKNRRQ